MNPADFKENKPGKIIKTLQGYWAYLPNPLPPQLPISWDIAKEISEADRSLSELAGVAKTLPNPHLLISPFIRREAVLSSRIEGTQASLSDLFFFEASEVVSTKSPDVLEVSNYVKALEYGLKRIKELPLSRRLMSELHALLLKGVRGEHLTPGHFRRTQNWIGPPGCTLNDAKFVPPPPGEMEEAMSQLEKYLHTPSSLPPLVKYALVHYQFEVIHPFLDGNGRIGRLLITLLLCLERILPQPLLYLSAYFEKHRDDYYRLLLSVSQTGAWIDWISYFLKGVQEQSKDALARSNRLISLQQEYRQKLQSKRSSALLSSLSDELFIFPAVTAAQVSKKFKITPRSAQQIIQKLIDLTILKEVTGKQRNRVYIAETIVKIIEAESA